MLDFGRHVTVWLRSDDHKTTFEAAEALENEMLFVIGRWADDGMVIGVRSGAGFGLTMERPAKKVTLSELDIASLVLAHLEKTYAIDDDADIVFTETDAGFTVTVEAMGRVA
jgi:hypothetical protein